MSFWDEIKNFAKPYNDDEDYDDYDAVDEKHHKKDNAADDELVQRLHRDLYVFVKPSQRTFGFFSGGIVFHLTYGPGTFSYRWSRPAE